MIKSNKIEFNPLEYSTVVMVKNQRDLVLWQPDLNLYHTIGPIEALPSREKIGGELLDFLMKVINQVKMAQAKNIVLSSPLKFERLSPSNLEYVTMKEAGKILGVSRTTVRNMADNKILEMRRTPGGHRLISVKSLKDYTHKVA